MKMNEIIKHVFQVTVLSLVALLMSGKFIVMYFYMFRVLFIYVCVCVEMNHYVLDFQD